MIPGVLTSIKKLIGIDESDDSFDYDILTHINTIGLFLSQIGVTEFDDLVVTDTTKWSDVFKERKDLEAVKTYIHLKVQLIFDPPTNTVLLKSLENNIAQLEWRIANLKTNKGVI